MLWKIKSSGSFKLSSHTHMRVSLVNRTSSSRAFSLWNSFLLKPWCYEGGKGRFFSSQAARFLVVEALVQPRSCKFEGEKHLFFNKQYVIDKNPSNTPIRTGVFCRDFKLIAAAAGLGGFFLWCRWRKDNIDVKTRAICCDSGGTSTEIPASKVLAGARKDSLPEYSTEEVSTHNSPEKGVWVIYKEGVYDISNFFEIHPGGRGRILLASGVSIEPFWNMYKQHHTEEVYELLESFRIGNLKKDGRELVKKSISVNETDSYNAEPARHPALRRVSEKPFNAETPLELLADSFITPNELFFVRNHLPVPTVEYNKYRLEVLSLEDNELKMFEMDALKKLPKKLITATLQCAGNRRSSLSEVHPVAGLKWSGGAIGNAVWGGASLTDVLSTCGITRESCEKNGINHIVFFGKDMREANEPYGASIPVFKALDPSSDIILAYEMNGEDLPLDHGYPLRVIIPGVIGARNVKWLLGIAPSKEQSRSFWQTNDYKVFPATVNFSNVNWETAPAIQEYPVQSAICSPQDGVRIEADQEEIEISGYAWSGGGRSIIRVEVSIDGGENWHQAKFFSPKNEGSKSVTEQESESPSKADDSDEDFEFIKDWSKRDTYHSWAWTLWRVSVPLPIRKAEAEGDKQAQSLDVCCRAIDAGYNTQPEKPVNVWNMRGCLCNSWHRIKVFIEGSKGD